MSKILILLVGEKEEPKKEYEKQKHKKCLVISYVNCLIHNK